MKEKEQTADFQQNVYADGIKKLLETKSPEQMTFLELIDNGYRIFKRSYDRTCPHKPYCISELKVVKATSAYHWETYSKHFDSWERESAMHKLLENKMNVEG